MFLSRKFGNVVYNLVLIIVFQFSNRVEIILCFFEIFRNGNHLIDLSRASCIII